MALLLAWLPGGPGDLAALAAGDRRLRARPARATGCSRCCPGPCTPGARPRAAAVATAVGWGVVAVPRVVLLGRRCRGPAGCSRSAPANSIGMIVLGRGCWWSRSARPGRAGRAGRRGAGRRASVLAGRRRRAAAGCGRRRWRGVIGDPPASAPSGRACWPRSSWRSSFAAAACAAGPRRRPAAGAGAGPGRRGAGSDRRRRSARGRAREARGDALAGRGGAGARLQHRRHRPARRVAGPRPGRPAGCRGHRCCGPAATDERSASPRPAPPSCRSRSRRRQPWSRPRRPRAAPGAAPARPRRGPRARPARRPGRRRARPPGRRPAGGHLAQRGARPQGLRGRALSAGGAHRGPRRRRHPRRVRATWSSGRPRWAPATCGSAPVAAPPLPPPPADRGRGPRASSASTPGQPLIASVGRLHPQKGYDVLIDAAARWRDRQPRPVVVIAGTGPSYLAGRADLGRARAGDSCSGTATTSPTCWPPPTWRW